MISYVYLFELKYGNCGWRWNYKKNYLNKVLDGFDEGNSWLSDLFVRGSSFKMRLFVEDSWLPYDFFHSWCNSRRNCSIGPVSNVNGTRIWHLLIMSCCCCCCCLRMRKCTAMTAFIRISRTHQMACMVILYLKNNLYFAVNQLAKNPIKWTVVNLSTTVEEVYCHDRFRPILTDLSHHWLYLFCRSTIRSWMCI